MANPDLSSGVGPAAAKPTSSTALVSVVLPCKDAARFIQPAISSVLAQTHSNLQLIVIDDGSTDQTIDLVESFTKLDPRVTLIALAENSGGPAMPRNEGIACAKGEFVAFIDADDIWLPHKLSLQLAVMQEYRLNFCSTLHRHFKDDSAIDSIARPMLSGQTALVSIAVPVTVPSIIKRINHSMILRKNCIVTSSVMLRSELLEHLHFSESVDFVAIEDYLAWLQLHQLPNIASAIIQEPLIFYRTRNDSISSSKVEMARKIYNLLSLYTVKGKRLGPIRFYYYATYLFGGVKSLTLSWLNRIPN